MSTAVFYSLSTACQYLTLYHQFVRCHYVHCSLIQPVHCLQVPHTIPDVCSVSLCPLLSSTVCQMCASTSHYTTCFFFVTMSTALFYSLSTVCQYLTLFHLFVLCHYVHCYILQSVHSLPVPHTKPPVCSVSLCPLLSSTVCPLSASTSHYTTSLFCVTMSTAVFYILSTVCQYFTPIWWLFRDTVCMLLYHPPSASLTSLTKRTVYFVIVRATKFGLVLLTGKSLWDIIYFVFLKYLFGFVWKTINPTPPQNQSVSYM